MPKVTEGGTTRSGYFDAYPLATPPAKPAAPDRVAVGFWNLSDRDVTVLVAGQNHTIQRGRSLKVEVPREFTWQVAGREPETRRVPAADGGLEIVLRQ